MVWSNFPTLLGTPSRRIQWDPWRELGRLQDELARFLGEEPRAAAGAGSSFPPVRIVTDEEGARLTALVPGLAAGEVEIVIERDTVRIEGQRKGPELQEGETFARQERRMGAFSRSFRLPFEVDATTAEARVQAGVLEVRLPRTPAQRPHRIEVRKD